MAARIAAGADCETFRQHPTRLHIILLQIILEVCSLWLGSILELR